MTEYRCYFMHFDHIKAVEMIDREDDGEAVRKAKTVFTAKVGMFSGFELWDRDRKVYAFSTSTRVQLDALPKDADELPPGRQAAK